ncbi:MAG: hypothetical protein LBS74_11120 [Oscillospiraceae bacterium]|jgi:uncharacterized protein with von Willebrand factor type A (vWA) domain|nr:hypothetical protein [Oscillospiraceae bacterium]
MQKPLFGFKKTQPAGWRWPPPPCTQKKKRGQKMSTQIIEMKANAYLNDAARAYAKLISAEKELKKQKEAAQAFFKSEMQKRGVDEIQICEYHITNKTNQRITFDSKAFKAAHPEMKKEFENFEEIKDVTTFLFK